MSTLESFKDTSTLTEFAVLLGYRPATLAYLLFKLPESKKYKKFTISKRGGGAREINAPIAPLKALQRRFADLLYDCCAEIDAEKPRQNSLSHGFRRSHSIVGNAWPHKNRRYVLNLDIEDFFPSFNFGRVRGFFLKNRDFELNEKVATVAAQIACHENSLPQGSPCSPIISNLITHVLDVRLAQLAKRRKCTYSRYADDLTFSSNQKVFPPVLASPTEVVSPNWVLGESLVKEIARAGFKTNDKKTRMQVRTSRQTVTGLTVNKKVNIRAEYYRSARAMCHSLFTSGEYFRPNEPTKKITTTYQLEGVLNHIHFVRDTVDRRPENEKKKDLTATRALYKRFLFFKHFTHLDKPLVLCEGKTDSIYLRCAVRSLPAFQPSLAEPDGKSFKYHVRFFKHSGIANKVLQLQGGTGEFKFLFRDYKVVTESFGHAPMQHPVIVFVDNDDGSHPVFSMIKQNFGVEIFPTAKKPFYHLCHNLYLAKTPEIGTKGTSCIEDFFDESVLKTKIGGKTFNPKKKHGTNSEYGKTVFAEQVVRKNADKIDFSRFEGILSRVVAAIDDYDSKTS